MTQRESAQQGSVTDQMREAARADGVPPEIIRDGIAAGIIVVCHNRMRQNGRPLAVGSGLRTKINANIGTSADDLDIGKELEKVRVAVQFGADALMDLSTGGPVDEIRRAIIAAADICIGSVPLYQAALDAVRIQKKAIVDMPADDIFRCTASCQHDDRYPNRIFSKIMKDRKSVFFRQQDIEKHEIE